ncbi:MAG: SRPBCC family protein, partial [Actinobacteria bacterium]|nr:SRPBCC family protein [Actinomycetota bacterium]
MTSPPFHTIELQHAVLVDAVPSVVYAMISDVTRMGEWSPECLRSTWASGPPGEVGSTFVGTNYERDVATGQEWEWDMACEVVAAECPRDFAWTVLSEAWDRDTSVWRFSLDAAPEGTLLTQTFKMMRPPKGWQPILDRHDRERQLELVGARRD